MGSKKHFLDSIQRLKGMNVLDKREMSTDSSSNTSKLNLSKAVEQLTNDPKIQKLTEPQSKALAEGIERLERKKVINQPKSQTIEQMGDL